MKTSDLTGPALDWAVAKCQGMPLIYRGRKWPTDRATTVEYAPWAVHPVIDGSGPYVAALCRSSYSPSTDWAQGGPIIEKYDIALCKDEGWWLADCAPEGGGDPVEQYGDTPLVAAMRCYVASRLGDEVEIPQELSS